MIAFAEAETATTQDVSLLPHQHAVFDAFHGGADWVGLVTGIGGGKTFVGGLWMVLERVQHPTALCVVTSNTYDQLDDVVVPALVSACENLELEHEYRSGKRLFFVEGAKAPILCRSTHKVHRLRGLEPDRLWVDEAREIESREAINVIRGRMRGQRTGGAALSLWTTSPNGYDHVWEEFVENPGPHHCLIRAKSTDNWHLPERYIPSLARGYSESFFRQEVEGEFVDLTGAKAIPTFDRHVHVKPCPYDDKADLFVCVDFNVDPFVVEIAQGNKVEARFIAEHVTHGLNIPAMGHQIGQRWGSHKLDVWLYGDATGHNRSVQTGRTNYAILVEVLESYFPGRVRVDIPKDQPPVVDRINTTALMFRDHTGAVRCSVDPSCRYLWTDCERVKWEKPGTIDKSDPDRTHALDGAGYMLHRRYRPGMFRAPTTAQLRALIR